MRLQEGPRGYVMLEKEKLKARACGIQLPFILSDCNLRARQAQIARVIEFSLHSGLFLAAGFIVRHGVFQVPTF